MTSNELRLAVIAINNTLSTNNPKGVTDALKRVGYPVDSRFDIMNYDSLTKALLELYVANPSQWSEVVRSVPFNYLKTDSSTNPTTRATFENIIRSFNPSDKSITEKTDKPKWWQTALNYVLGSTTTTEIGGFPSSSSQKTSPWVYVGFSVIGILIFLIVLYALRAKNI